MHKGPMNTKENGKWNTYSGSHHLHTSLLPASSCRSARKREYVLVNNPSYNNTASLMSGDRQERKVEMYIVSKILMRRSQLQPVTTNAAAGGNIMATRMRTTSEALTMVNVDCKRLKLLCWSHNVRHFLTRYLFYDNCGEPRNPEGTDVYR